MFMNARSLFTHMRLAMGVLALAGTLASCKGTVPVEPTVTATAGSQPTFSTPSPTSFTPTKTPTVLPPLPLPTRTPAPQGNITIWAPPRMHSQLETAQQAFSLEYPGIQVNWVSMDPEEILQALSASHKAGFSQPDVIYIETTQIGSAVSMGVFERPGNAILNEAEFVPGVLNHARWGGELYAIPLHMDPVLLFYRRDLLSKAGMDPDPKSVAQAIPTWDDLLEVCQKIKQKTGKVCFDLNRASNDGFLYETIYRGIPGTYFNSTGKINLAGEDSLLALDTLLRFWRAGVTGDESAWSQAWLDHLSAGEPSAAFVIGTASLAFDCETWIAPDLPGKWGIVRVPSVSGQAESGANAGGGYLGIVNGSQNQLASRLWVATMTQDPDYLELMLENGRLFPANLRAYDQGLVYNPDAYFSGQDLAQIVRDAAGTIGPQVFYSSAYGKIHPLIEKAIRAAATGILTPEQALKNAEKEYSHP